MKRLLIALLILAGIVGLLGGAFLLYYVWALGDAYQNYPY